jgi:hypothetical protein
VKCSKRYFMSERDWRYSFSKVMCKSIAQRNRDTYTGKSATVNPEDTSVKNCNPSNALRTT